MRTNVQSAKPTIRTHEGAVARHISPEQALRRSVLATLLWEDQFYEDGQSIADRIVENATKVSTASVAALAIEARNEHGLRHAPLMLLLGLIARGGAGVADAVAETIRRPDEAGELVSLFWRNGRKSLPRQMRVGLAKALLRFDEYQLAKYDRAGDAVRLRDVIFMAHPKTGEHVDNGRRFAKLVNKTFVPVAAKSGFKVREVYGLGENEVGLSVPDTWEVALSAGGDKRESFERLLREGKLGYLAVLRNLRNMVQAGVDTALIEDAILARKGARWVFPFRYVAAARAVPQLEPLIDKALVAAVAEGIVLSGTTAVLVDVSGSMDKKLSGKSDLTRADAAAALASVLGGTVRMFSFSSHLVEVPPRRGMAGIDALLRSQSHSATQLIAAVRAVNQTVKYDRMIVITDEQAASDRNQLPDPTGRGYMINVASAQNGIGYGKWVHIDGFSEAVIRYMHQAEMAPRDDEVVA